MTPRFADRLLRRSVPRGAEGDTIRGDVIEEFAARRRRSRAGAWLWYWSVALSMRLRYPPR